MGFDLPPSRWYGRGVKRAATIAVIAVGALLFAGATATAHKKEIATDVALTGNAQGTFQVSVQASGGCRKVRRVSLFHTDEYSGRTLIGTATANAAGEAAFSPSTQPAGSYQAVVAPSKVKKGKKKNGKPRHKHKCLEGTSTALSYGGGPNPGPPVTPPVY